MSACELERPQILQIGLNFPGAMFSSIGSFQFQCVKFLLYVESSFTGFIQSVKMHKAIIRPWLSEQTKCIHIAE